MELDKYEVRCDNWTSLREIFGYNQSCLYTDDFGDGWEHEILLEKVVKDSHNRFPVLLEREGERPPEDVGGPGGFEEYLNIISDPGSPEYESVLQWSEITKAKKKTIEELTPMKRLMRRCMRISSRLYVKLIWNGQRMDAYADGSAAIDALTQGDRCAECRSFVDWK